MNKLIITLWFVVFLGGLNGQSSVNDEEFKKLAYDVAIKIKDKLKSQNLAIADFVDENDIPSKLGTYLSEELSYSLVNQLTNFKLIDRTQLRSLMVEADLGETGMVDPKDIKRLGKLEGIDAMLYGKVIPSGNYLKVYVKVVLIEEQQTIVNVRGKITQTPSIQRLIGIENKSILTDCPCDCEETTAKKSGTVASASFQYENIKIEVKQCTRNGSNIDCELLATSIGKGDNLILKSDGTYITDISGNVFGTGNLFNSSGGRSTIQINQPLTTNKPTPIGIRFKNVSGTSSNIARMSLNCKSFAAFDFTAQLKNINIK